MTVKEGEFPVMKKTFKTSFLVLVVFLAVCVRDFDACLFPKMPVFDTQTKTILVKK